MCSLPSHITDCIMAVWCNECRPKPNMSAMEDFMMQCAVQFLPKKFIGLTNDCTLPMKCTASLYIDHSI